MLKSLKQQSGITIVESMLVAVISILLIGLSVSQYESYKRDSDTAQLTYNVEQVLQAAGYYYQANCRNQFDATTGKYIMGSSALDPANNPGNPFNIDAYADLYNDGFLKANITRNPLVYYPTPNTQISAILKPYRVQFNLTTPQQQRVVALSDGTTANLGKIFVWRIQVSVLMKDSATAQAYYRVLKATCLSRAQGNIILPCPAVPTPPTSQDTYMVFERLPSLTGSETNFGLNVTNATINQFNQTQTTAPMLYLTGSSSGSTEQNYLCGT